MTNVFNNDDIYIKGGTGGAIDSAGLYWNYGGSEIFDNGSLNISTANTNFNITNANTNGNIHILGSSISLDASSQYMYIPSGITPNSVGTPLPLYIVATATPQYLTVATSTERYKENIVSLPDDRYTIENFMKLNPIQYNSKENYGDINIKQIGFTAENAKELGLDELVAFNADKTECNYFYYERLTSYIVKIVQLQQKKIEELETELNSIKKTIK